MRHTCKGTICINIMVVFVAINIKYNTLNICSLASNHFIHVTARNQWRSCAHHLHRLTQNSLCFKQYFNIGSWCLWSVIDPCFTQMELRELKWKKRIQIWTEHARATESVQTPTMTCTDQSNSLNSLLSCSGQHDSICIPRERKRAWGRVLMLHSF